jgi:hypothetical protein
MFHDNYCCCYTQLNIRFAALRMFVSISAYTVANPTPHKDVLPDAMINFQVSTWQDRPDMLAMVGLRVIYGARLSYEVQLLGQD